MGTAMLITFSGVDGSGKTTHSKRLAKSLGAAWRCFPDRTTPIGELVDAYLKGDLKAQWLNGRLPDKQLNALVLQALMAANKYEVAPAIRRILMTQKHLVFDRWAWCAHAYGVADGLDGHHLDELHDSLPEPHLNILLDVTVGDALERLARRPNAAALAPERYENRAAIAKAIVNYREFFYARGEDPRFHVIRADRSFDTTERDIHELVERHIGYPVPKLDELGVAPL